MTGVLWATPFNLLAASTTSLYVGTYPVYGSCLHFDDFEIAFVFDIFGDFLGYDCFFAILIEKN